MFFENRHTHCPLKSDSSSQPIFYVLQKLICHRSICDRFQVCRC